MIQVTLNEQEINFALGILNETPFKYSVQLINFFQNKITQAAQVAQNPSAPPQS